MTKIKIPKIIHQTWKNECLPVAFMTLSQTWRDMLPDWEYHLWTDEMNREFVRIHFPDFLKKYDAYPRNIQRADAIRYLLLYTYGGLYVDMDFECLKPEFVTLLEDAEFIAGKEPYLHAHSHGREYIVCNALMASIPNYPFLEFVIHRMMNHPHGWNVRHGRDILDSTGPFLLSDAYREYPQKNELKIIEPELLYPILLGESKYITQGHISADMTYRIKAAYAIHHFFGTWW